jgi:hypothetical protein
MNAANQVPMTIRIAPPVSEALARKAADRGLETADYAAELVTAGVLDAVAKADPDTALRLTAEMGIKAKAIAIVRGLVAEQFDPDVTLRVFRQIAADPKLLALYSRAVGGLVLDERGNPVKARINRTLGAAIKTAVGATPATKNGAPEKIQVGPGELIFTYTRLVGPRGK